MRVKATCEKCNRTVLLLIEERDQRDIGALEKGEFFDHFCDQCNCVTVWVVE